MFKENTHTQIEDYPIFSSYSNFMIDDINVDKSIQKSIIEKSMLETCVAFLKVEDKGEKILGNSTIEIYFGSFRIYEISLTDEKNAEKIKCFRRYSNFVKLDKKLRDHYPYYIIPELPPKNPLLKIKNPSDQEFYQTREKGLNFYLNSLFNKSNLSNTLFFKKFLNDPEFVYNFLISKDEEYFATNECITGFPIHEKYTKSIKNKMKNLLFGYFQYNII